MIQANELRVGNIVLYENKVTECTEDFLEVFFAVRKYEDLFPIELTPKILENAGFRFCGPPWFEKGEISVNLKDGKVCINQPKGQVFLNTKTKYFHQLQNLYFALTGEELEKL